MKTDGCHRKLPIRHSRAKPGIQALIPANSPWIPAFAGMTDFGPYACSLSPVSFSKDCTKYTKKDFPAKAQRRKGKKSICQVCMCIFARKNLSFVRFVLFVLNRYFRKTPADQV